MYKLRRRLSQNFLHSRKLISKLLDKSFIGKNDIVLEIGAGKGIITEQLIVRAKHVLAIELDSYWFNYLRTKFSNVNNLNLYQGNFLGFSLPRSPYKVFANIPFTIEGKIIRKLIDSENPPEDCYIIIRKDLAYRLSAQYKENQFSIMHKPWFSFSIYYRFNGKDFIPHTKVNVVMMRFRKRAQPILPLSEKFKYQNFIRLGFGNGLPIFENLKRVWGFGKTLNAIRKVQIDKQTKPSHLSLQQWVNLYREFIA